MCINFSITVSTNVDISTSLVVSLIIRKILCYGRQSEKSSRTVDTFHWRVPSDDVYIGFFNQMRRSVIDLLILLNILHNSNEIILR